MDKINITQNQFSDLINLLNGVFSPVENFVTKFEFLEIINNKNFKIIFFLFQFTLEFQKKYTLNLKIKINLIYTTRKNIY